MIVDEVVSRYWKLIPRNGAVADLGCGPGSNTLFLAKQGFSVDAVDHSPECITTLARLAKDWQLEERINPINARIEESPLHRPYAAIICTFVLHFLGPRALETLGRIQAATLPGGLNIIRTFTERGEWPQERKRGHYLKPDELRERYAGWDILFYEEKLVKTRECDGQGNPLMQEAASIVARKHGEVPRALLP
jgi:tellurite methyltransferase